MLPPSLALPMLSKDLAVPDVAVGRVCWLEVSNSPDRALTAMSGKCVHAWQLAGIDVRAQAVAGNAFWQTQEIEVGTTLITETVESMRP